MLEFIGWLVVQGFFTIGLFYLIVLGWFASCFNEWKLELETFIYAGIVCAFGAGTIWAWSLKPFSIIFGG